MDYVPDQAAVPFTNHAAITQATAMCTNKTLKCQRFNEDGSACNEDFVWTAEEQMLHKRLGYTSTPKSCPKHKQPPRHYANDKCPKITGGAPADCGNAEVEKCRLFQARKCGFGDQCKFSHCEGENKDQLAIAYPAVITDTEDDSDDDLIVWHMHLEDDDYDDINQW